MSLNPAAFENSRNNKIIFIVSLLVSSFWLLGNNINVYYYALAGAIIEILWLPMVALLFLLPIVSLIFFWKDKFNLGSLALYSAFVMIMTILVIIFLN